MKTVAISALVAASLALAVPALATAATNAPAKTTAAAAKATTATNAPAKKASATGTTPETAAIMAPVAITAPATIATPTAIAMPTAITVPAAVAVPSLRLGARARSHRGNHKAGCGEDMWDLHRPFLSARGSGNMENTLFRRKRC